MKNTLLLLCVASILLFSAGCRKDRGVYYGSVIFWFDANNGQGTVNIAGQTGIISGFVTGGVPSCGNAVSANFTLPVGSYSYTATASNGYSWNGTADVSVDRCQAYELH